MKPEILEILLALLDRPRHGYAIMQFVAQRNGGEMKILPGALYRHLERLTGDGLVEVVREDDRRQTYDLTRAGRVAVTDETKRLSSAVAFARRRLAGNDN